MMFGGYGPDRETLPRVAHIALARYRPALPRPGEPLEFLVSIHEEGTGFTWQQNIALPPETERYFLDTVQSLYLWSRNLALTPARATSLVEEMGRRLYEAFIGEAGEACLNRITPTAILLNVDETILNLPWELISLQGGAAVQSVPFGRLVTTRLLPRPGRDPLQEDAEVNILAVANPTADLAATEGEIAALNGLQRDYGRFRVRTRVLAREEATLEGLRRALREGDWDILHFAGHAYFDPAGPERSALRLADGYLTADEAMALPWKAAPYLVFNSACESGRAAGGQRLVSESGHSSGLAAAFLAAGAFGYAGYFWPVTDTGASRFAGAFYQTLFERENVGLAFLTARQSALRALQERGDLTGCSAVLYGDAASAHRRDYARAV